MKHSLIYLMFLIFLAPLTFAENLIYSGTVITDTDKVIENGIFRFRYDENTNKVFVQTPHTGMIVDNGACESSGVFRVCINRANFSYKNITTYVYYYELHVDIYKLTGSLTATSVSNPSTLLQGEPAEITVTLSNPTDFDIIDVVYQQNFSQFFISQVKACNLTENGIEWRGSLKSRYDKTCIIKVIAQEEGTYNLVGSLSYFNWYETEKKATDTLKVTVLPKQLKAEYTIDKDIEIKIPFHINISLQNVHQDEEIDASLTIELPNNLTLRKDVSGFNKNFNILKRNLVMKPSSIYNYSLYLEAASQITQPIRHKFDYTIKNTRDLIENYTFIGVIEPKPTITFTSEYDEVTPGQKLIFVVKIKNPSNIYDLTNIKARLNVPFNNIPEQSLDKLLPNESYPIISNTIVVPSNDLLNESTGKMLNLDFHIEYKFSDTAESIDKNFQINLKQEDKKQEPVISVETNEDSQENNHTTQEKNETFIEQSLRNVTGDTSVLPETKFQELQETQKVVEAIRTNIINKESLKIAGIIALILSSFVTIMYVFISLKIKRRIKKQPEKQKAIDEIQERLEDLNKKT